MESNEETIWRNIQLKNLETFEWYYKENFKKFFFVTSRYIKDTLEAQEIVNDVFIKIWIDGEKLQIDNSLKSYIYKSVINRSINALDKKKREIMARKFPEEIHILTYDLLQVEEEELENRIYLAINHLPDKCRRVFEMSRFEDLKQKEIAHRLGISVKTVKNHIHIALRILSPILLEYFGIIPI